MNAIISYFCKYIIVTMKVIYQLEPEHIPQLVTLFKNEWWSRKRQLEDTTEMLENTPTIIGIIDEETNELIGFCRVITDRIFKALIMDVIVKRGSRGMGIGIRLSDEIHKHPHLKKVRHIDLLCSDEMVQFYEKFGYEDYNKKVHIMRRYINEEPFL